MRLQIPINKYNDFLTKRLTVEGFEGNRNNINENTARKILADKASAIFKQSIAQGVGIQSTHIIISVTDIKKAIADDWGCKPSEVPDRYPSCLEGVRSRLVTFSRV